MLTGSTLTAPLFLSVRPRGDTHECHLEESQLQTARYHANATGEGPKADAEIMVPCAENRES